MCFGGGGGGGKKYNPGKEGTPDMPVDRTAEVVRVRPKPKEDDGLQIDPTGGHRVTVLGGGSQPQA